MDVRLIIQARQGSVRFPNKWKADINGTYAIDYVIDAVKHSKYYNITNLYFVIPKQDDELIEYITDKGINVVNDKDRNVYQGFVDIGGDIQARITGDSPCIDPEQIDVNIDKVIEGYEYASNEITTFGNCAEAFTWAALNKYKPEHGGDKEHATLALRRNSLKRWLPSLMIDYEENLETVAKWLK